MSVPEWQKAARFLDLVTTAKKDITLLRYGPVAWGGVVVKALRY
jgi:hypothetical protein